MKRYLIIFLAVVSAVCHFSASAQFRYGPMAGVSLTDLKYKQRLFGVDQEVGFSAGVGTELMFSGIGFGINSGVFYTMRGATLHLGDRYVWSSQGYGNVRSYLHYLEIPINLRFKWTRMNGFEDYLAPFVFAGPTFEILLANSQCKALEHPRGDIGMVVGLGFEIMKHWQVQASYNWGVTYAEQTRLLDDNTAKNRSWDFKVVYLF